MSELHGLQTTLQEIEATGAKLAAICVDPVETNREVVERLSLGFPILSDPELRAIDAFGLRHAAGAPGGGDIARPAVYVAQGGVIRWRSLPRSYRVRLRPDEVLSALRAAE